jgi:hypothetical protein
MDFGGGMGGSGGLFGIYNQVLGYKKNKAQESIQSGNYQNALNQANNNLAITKEQAPLIPQEAADSFAARGVGQSTFGNGLGNQWAQPPATQTMVDPHTGAPAPAGGAGQYIKPVSTNIPSTSGEGQPVGTGLQRARDLSTSMVSNATSQQAAAQNAYDQYQKVIKDTRHQFYTNMAADAVSAIMGLFL